MKATGWIPLALAVFLSSALLGKGRPNDPLRNDPKNNPTIGSWTLDGAKSQLKGPAPKKEVLRLEQDGDTVTADFEELAANGRHIGASTTLQLNGRNYPIRGSAPYGADSVSGRQSSANTTEATLMRGGAVVAMIRASVSRNGEIATITVSAKERGRTLNERTVWDRCAVGAACGTQS